MLEEIRVPLFDLVLCLSDAIDLVSPSLVNHHKQVAYIASAIGAEMGLPGEQQNELIMAGALHDIGALSDKERLSLIECDAKDSSNHPEIGYSFIKMFEPLAGVAHLVRFHHIPWDDGRGAEFKNEHVPIGSRILFLADQVARYLNVRQDVLGVVNMIHTMVKEKSGKMFMPELVDVFKGLCAKEFIWFDVTSPKIGSVLRRKIMVKSIELDIRRLHSLANIFRGIIDFRSRFTANHSTGVAASLEALARLAGFSERECLTMKVAGYLHDLGKLAVPTKILEKPGKLTNDEVDIIRSHTYHTYRTLEPIGDLNVINAWGSYHHECLDGNGYPFHIKGNDLSLGSRIMAVADVFTAITEDRPYREGMSSEKALQIIQGMADNSKLDPNVVTLLKQNFDEVNSHRIAAQKVSFEEYHQLMQLAD